MDAEPAAVAADAGAVGVAGPAAAAAASPEPVQHHILPRLLTLRFRGVPVLTLFLLGFALCVIAGNWLPTRADRGSTEQSLEEQRRENRSFAERIRVAEAEAVQVEKDPWRHERILRDELRMSRAGEVIIR